MSIAKSNSHLSWWLISCANDELR